ncbi:MAG: hypothetical protein MI700_06065 [Balneolales bacterium]|nr:hypothetical protein [Balneolales bacterium]
MLTSRPLPFYDDELNSGFMKLEGILRLEGDHINIEFQRKDSIMEVIKSGVKSLNIPLTDLEMIEYKKKLGGGRVILYAKRAVTFEDFPGGELTTRTLKISRKHRDIAASLASNVNLILSEKKLRELDEGTE